VGGRPLTGGIPPLEPPLSINVLLDAGCADCVRYAEVELLAEQLASSLRDFQLHKIVKLPHEWNVCIILFYFLAIGI